jgi:thioesterase domain-containing protein
LPAPVEVQLFRATIRAVDDSGDPLMGWGLLAQGGVTVRDVSADHLSILSEPAVSGVALSLRHSIDETETLRDHRSGSTR